MQDKNKREGSRRSRRDKKRRTKEVEDAASKSQLPTTSRLPPPGSPISDLALVRFADPDINAEAKGMAFKAVAYNVVNRVLSPLERWIDFGSIETVPFEWLLSDTAFLHTILCASYAINDSTVSHWDRKPGRKTVFHLRQALSLLQIKMRNEYVYLEETVLHVVLNLALLGAMFDDWQAAAVHYKGLQKMVQLRGNLEFLRARPKLHFRLDRIDLNWTLSSGKKPYFLHPTLSWDSIIPASHSPLLQGLYRPSLKWDSRLRNIFLDMQYLTLRTNYDVLEQTRCSAAYFQGVLTSLQSRLYHLTDLLESPVEELIRLTMMAYLTTTFNNPGRKIPYEWVIERLKETYTKAAGGLFEQDKSLYLWTLIVIAFTITGAQEEWVKGAWLNVGSHFDWEAVKIHMKQVMLIEIVHDGPGKKVFQQLESLVSSDEVVEL